MLVHIHVHVHVLLCIKRYTASDAYTRVYMASHIGCLVPMNSFASHFESYVRVEQLSECVPEVVHVLIYYYCLHKIYSMLLGLMKFELQ